MHKAVIEASTRYTKPIDNIRRLDQPLDELATRVGNISVISATCYFAPLYQFISDHIFDFANNLMLESYSHTSFTKYLHTLVGVHGYETRFFII